MCAVCNVYIPLGGCNMHVTHLNSFLIHLFYPGGINVSFHKYVIPILLSKYSIERVNSMEAHASPYKKLSHHF